MRFHVLALALSLAALSPVVSCFFVDVKTCFYCDKSTRHAAAAAGYGRFAHARLDVEEDVPVGPNGMKPIVIETAAHSIASAVGKHIKKTALQAQIKVLNDSFAPHGISFRLNSIERVLKPTWAMGLDRERMMWHRNRADGGPDTLNLYFIQMVGGNPDNEASVSSPHSLLNDPAAFRIDGISVRASTVPRGPGWTLESGHEGKSLVKAVGFWLGLKEPTHEGCSEPNDSIDDTPAARELPSRGFVPLDWIRVRPCREWILCTTTWARRPSKRCPFSLFTRSVSMSLSRPSIRGGSRKDITRSCRWEFTQGQAQHMRHIWHTLRARPRRQQEQEQQQPWAPLSPSFTSSALRLRRLEPITHPDPDSNDTRLPWYPNPESRVTAAMECLPDCDGVVRETRESWCGTQFFCAAEAVMRRRREGVPSPDYWFNCTRARVLPLSEDEGGDEGIAETLGHPVRLRFG